MMNKKVILLLLAALAILPVSAQTSRLFQRRELVEMEDESETLKFEIFAMDEEGGSQYYLNVGHLGFGNKVVQVQLDPVFNLFIKLGDSLEESVATMERFLDQIKDKPGTVTETVGYLNVAVPGEKAGEQVTVTTCKPLLTRYLQFSVEREGYIRAADIHKSDLRSLIFSLKAYRKIHPKEK